MLPSSYVIGEEYILDQNEIDVKIGYMFMGILFPWLMIGPTIIDYPFGRIEILTNPSDYSTTIFIYRKIPSSLYTESTLESKDVGNYFRGYLSDALTYITPILKRDTLNRGYLTPIYPTQKNLVGIGLLQIPNTKNMEEPKFVQIMPTLDTFPFSSIVPVGEHIQDLLEAMQGFINLDISESLRSLFSSLDTLRKLYLSKKEKDFEFIESIEFLLSTTTLSQTIKETILYNLTIGYTLRNQIVHKSKRLSYQNINLVHQVLSSVLYLYKGLDTRNFDYYMELEIQFLMVKNHYFGDNLDYVELPSDDISIVQSSDNLDEIMMENMKISASREEIKNLLQDF